MPEKTDKSQDRQTDARKKPEAPGKERLKAKSPDREARLAEALRANLRRRKAPKAGAEPEPGGAEVEKEK